LARRVFLCAFGAVRHRHPFLGLPLSPGRAAGCPLGDLPRQSGRPRVSVATPDQRRSVVALRWDPPPAL